MPTIAVVYHSGFGHTEVLAHRVAGGAGSVGGCEGVVIKSAELPDPDMSSGKAVYAGRWGELDAADAIVFGTPTYMGTVSAEFKRFMDASSGAWFDQRWANKLAAGFTTSGSPSGDKLNVLTTLAVFAGQHSMLWVPTGVHMEGEHNRLGSYLGLMAQSDNAPASETPPESDRVTADRFGANIANAALRWAG
ncbi:MAG: flavodoxin family protein [Planctomycetota bacterium]